MHLLHVIGRCHATLAVVMLGMVVGTNKQARADLTFELSSDSDPSALEAEESPSVTHNLGSFNIVINAGAALAGNAAALAAFNRAADRWEAYISDPITVNVDANLDSMTGSVLGSASTTIVTAGYAVIRQQMVLDANAESGDDAIVPYLPNSYPTFAVPSGFGVNGTNLNFTQANAKALGFGVPGGADGSITFNSNFNFDYDNSNGVTAFSYDFETVAVHEIGHVLGFYSVVNSIDTLMSNGQVSADIRPATLDLFRFQNGGANDPDENEPGDFTTMTRSLMPGGDAIFDQVTASNGSEDEIAMSTGRTQGDGNQASHWKDDFISSTLLGVMDPTLSDGVVSPITLNDLRALDLIGYNINISAIPEARAYFMLAVVACLVGIGGSAKKLRSVRQRAA